MDLPPFEKSLCNYIENFTSYNLNLYVMVVIPCCFLLLMIRMAANAHTRTKKVATDATTGTTGKFLLLRTN